jgi:hypothetical protein
MKYPIKYCVQGGKESDDGGAFKIPFNKKELYVIASHGGHWEHVSVSLENRCPTWEEMCFVKNLFFNEEDCVIQYHPPKSNYINVHKYVLHLWKPMKEKIPMPPESFV